MTIWEYKIDVGLAVSSKPKRDETLSTLNKCGEEGWELVALLPSQSTSDMLDWWIYKRPKSVTRDIRVKLQKR